MKFFNKTTDNPPTWSRGTLTGTNSQLGEEAGARPLFSNPLDEDAYDIRFDRRQGEYMNVRDTNPTDKSIGGKDA